MNIILVHGGWHGGWTWDGVAAQLRALGHQVYAPSLTGLAERAHLIDAVEGPDTHVADITQLISFHNLQDVVLVGHSYGGMIVTGAASHLSERIKALVYLDAFVPTKSGMPANQMATPERAAEIRASIRPDGTIAPNGFERWAADPEAIAMLKQKCTPHPAACFGKGVTLTGREKDVAHKSYILCEKHQPPPFWQFYEKYVNDPAWSTTKLPCLHDAMIEMPDRVVELIDAAVAAAKKASS
ncbi:MAG: alpha/beta hydrolase [Rhizobiaceae bacterium]|nr:alpha/beta hydrolase [Rhizobiaceae bacterium]